MHHKKVINYEGKTDINEGNKTMQLSEIINKETETRVSLSETQFGWQVINSVTNTL
jgi:hypothetical protein